MIAPAPSLRLTWAGGLVPVCAGVRLAQEGGSLVERREGSKVLALDLAVDNAHELNDPAAVGEGRLSKSSGEIGQLPGIHSAVARERRREALAVNNLGKREAAAVGRAIDGDGDDSRRNGRRNSEECPHHVAFLMAPLRPRLSKRPSHSLAGSHQLGNSRGRDGI
jgi:hypothetical protein